MTSHSGRMFSLSELKGHPVLLFFGFTHCRTICPTTMQDLREVRRLVAQSSGAPEIVFMSVDGERDDVDTLRQFVEPFGEGFTGLTDSPVRVQKIAAEYSAVFFKGMATDTEGGYDMQHTSQVYLIDAAGFLVAVFYASPLEDIVTALNWINRQS